MVYYTEYAGGHDYLYWQGSLADGLINLIGKDSRVSGARKDYPPSLDGAPSRDGAPLF
jgi:hypothetical protein